MIKEQQHWDSIYQNKSESELSWFQPYPKTSMEFIALFNLPREANIIDIGGGDAHFVDVLLDNGYKNIWVLDISANAIERAKERLGASASKVNWIVSDVTEFIPPVKFDFWHDRAAFHFLTSESRISKYVSIAEEAIQKDGYFVLGTFSRTGPKSCSGLMIKQYSEASMSERFDVSFKKIKCIEEDHVTPFHTVQSFLFCSFQRK